MAVDIRADEFEIDLSPLKGHAAMCIALSQMNRASNIPVICDTPASARGRGLRVHTSKERDEQRRILEVFTQTLRSRVPSPRLISSAAQVGLGAAILNFGSVECGGESDPPNMRGLACASAKCTHRLNPCHRTNTTKPVGHEGYKKPGLCE